MFETAGEVSVFGFQAVTDLFRRPFEGQQIRQQLAEIGSKSLPLVVASGFALGAVLTLHTRSTLVTFGATAWIPTVQALAFFLEIGPLVTGLLVAGRVGSGIGAVLSNMRATEQIDAIESLSIDSFKFLVVPRIVADIVKPDSQGMRAGTNIRESLTNANTASSNLADATEALKHNFLTRGFFKKRGYYNLAEMSPEEYRKERAFTNSANRRVWLSGSALFQKGSNGEELSPAGKELLNAALTVNGDPTITGPIVIEGYWNGNVPAEQLRFSRSRAALVRQYLQARFQLDPRDLGIVPLKNLPPKGVQHAAWDGICIVVLKGA